MIRYRVVDEVTYRISEVSGKRVVKLRAIEEYYNNIRERLEWSKFDPVKVGLIAPEGISIASDDIVVANNETRTIERIDGKYNRPPLASMVATILYVNSRKPQSDGTHEWINVGTSSLDWKAVVGVVPCSLKIQRDMQCRFKGVASDYNGKPQLELVAGGIEVLSEDCEHDPAWVIAHSAFKQFNRAHFDKLVEEFGLQWPERVTATPSLLDRFSRWHKTTPAGIIRASVVVVSTPQWEKDLYMAGFTLREIHKIEPKLILIIEDKRDPVCLVRYGVASYKQVATILEKGKWFRDRGVDRGLMIIWDHLYEAKKQGKTAVTLSIIRERLADDYRQTADQIEATLTRITPLNGLEVTGKGKFASVAFHDLVRLECGIISRVKEYSVARFSRPFMVNPDLDPDQIKAVSAAMNNGLSIITGWPGTGKTYLCREIARHCQNALGIAVAARTALRLGERAGIERMTIEQFRRRSAMDINSLFTDCLIVDEASMVASGQLRIILDVAAKIEMPRIVLVGDVDQLPPISEGNPFADLITSGLVPVARLTQIHRVDKGSGIARLARDVNDGVADVLDKLVAGEYPDVTAQSLPTPMAVDYIVADYLSLIARDVDAEDIGVLTPFSDEKFDISSGRLNRSVRSALNYPADRPVEGDIVVGTRNERKPHSDKTVLNGSRGIVVEATYGRDGEGWLCADFDCDEETAIWRSTKKHPILSPKTGLPSNVGYGYATTIHKAQGAEYEHVLVIVSGQCQGIQALYTAFSRAKGTLKIVGDLEAIPRLIASASSPYKERSTVMRAIFGKVETPDPTPSKEASMSIAERLAALPDPEPGDLEDDFAELDMT